MINSQRDSLSAELAIIIAYPTSTSGIIVFSKHSRNISRYDLANFSLRQFNGLMFNGLMVAISRVWYNGSYTMAAKPIKFLKLHYTIIQFLIK